MTLYPDSYRKQCHYVGRINHNNALFKIISYRFF